jgi:hypothetical protein
VNNEDGFDPQSLDRAVRTAHAERPRRVVSIAERREQRRRVADAHDELYRSLLR